MIEMLLNCKNSVGMCLKSTQLKPSMPRDSMGVHFMQLLPGNLWPLPRWVVWNLPRCRCPLQCCPQSSDPQNFPLTQRTQGQLLNLNSILPFSWSTVCTCAMCTPLKIWNLKWWFGIGMGFPLHLLHQSIPFYSMAAHKSTLQEKGRELRCRVKFWEEIKGRIGRLTIQNSK